MTPSRPDYVDVVAVRDDRSAPAGETTVIRLLGLLPGHWPCLPEVRADRIRLRIALDAATDPRTVSSAVSRALADSALRGWSRRRD
ncbi:MULTISPECIES: hypothetical protein [unclassified Streptomyces]|uniref:hypothetical protein n=1 Tax=unclassified Streptomyces TaxID=2593676 RepID=UPI000F44D79C|nr:hypothetical protein [Streptomyces sp. I6]RNL73700.1 hypothetical protein EBF04_28030 [Streptomyces sp. I6]